MAKGRSSLIAVSEFTQLISLLTMCLLLLAPVYAQNRRDEVSTLQSFVNLTGVRGGYPNTWNFSEDNACAWAGVTCTTNFTVAELDLSNSAVSAYKFTFAPLSSLKDLLRVDLSSNNLGQYWVGFLPDDIGSLTGLTWLDVSHNNFIGEIPASISSCRRLRFLSLEQNGFTGATSSTLSDLKDLQFLFLAQNHLSGPVPAGLTELTSLVSIDLSNNFLSGSIPAFPKLTKLVSLKLNNNTFTKFEESWFSTTTVSQSLEILSVSFNQLEDVLPSDIIMPNLQVFNMSGNRLSGRIPSFSGMKNIISVDLSQNQFNGKIPSDLFVYNVPDPTLYCGTLNLSYNLLTGIVPLNGTIFCFDTLDLSHNDLSGFLPSTNISTNNSTRITNNFWLGHNHISGDFVDIINDIIIDLFWTSELRLENNLFTGDLSKLATANLPNLQVMDLTNNSFQWRVSQRIPDPITVTLHNLTGQSPLQEFHAGGNNFSGTSLPTTCFNDKYHLIDTYLLQVLDLSGNHLKGEMLSTVFNSECLGSLQLLDLSNNDIFGTLPDSIVVPSLEILNVSYNHLSGHLPLSLYDSASLSNPKFFEGNKGLCGYPLSLCLQGTGPGVQWWVLLISIGGSLLIALGSCLVATWRWRVYHKRHQQDADLIKTLLERESAALMPLRELKKATENFAESAQIGEGGFGTVYVGQLNNGTIVAIKRSKREGSLKDKEQFLNEVRILSQVSHRNLVKLLGCCMENKIALLVFEFISNGTLQEHLGGKIGAVPLTWEQRLKIAMQTADALNYLHSAAVFPIYHRDVKSANILLDNSLNAKVGDFGISKLAPLQVTHVSTIAIQGTIGYIDPEYYTSYRLTDKSDVYSFGVVLLELISAKPALDFRKGGDNNSLVYFASQYIESEDLHGLIDPALTETYEEVVGTGRKSILTLSKLAMKCLDMQSKARPDMNEVFSELRNLRAELPGISKDLEDRINEDDDAEFWQDRTGRLSSLTSRDSSSFAIESDGNSMKMSQIGSTTSW